MRLLILIPAAGSSSRMRGRDKLLEEIDAVPQLRRAIEAATGTGQDILVTLPPKSPARVALVGDAVWTVVAGAAEGMAASLREGVRQARGYDGLMILPADMPELRTEDLMQVIKGFAAAPKHVVRGASEDGRPGHPVILPARMFKAVTRLEGDTGARPLITAGTVQLIPLPGQHALTDLDTPEDWDEWCRSSGKSGAGGGT